MNGTWWLPESHVDYMMGHVTDTYNDIQSLGIEKLRQEYAASGLTIRTQTPVSKMETIKEMIRAMGEDPDKILTREAQTQPATTHLQTEDYDNHHLQILYQHLREAFHREATKPSMQ